MHFNMTVNLTYSPSMNTDNSYYRTIISDVIEVIRYIGEEKPVPVLYR